MLKVSQHRSKMPIAYPKAPVAALTAWGPDAMYCPHCDKVSWFDMDFLPIGEGDDPPSYGCSLDEAKKSLSIIHDEIDKMVESGVPPNKIVVAGMSQGGYMALRAALTYPKKLGGAWVHNGMMMYPDELKENTS